jgi:oligoribonuclease NrnB/cAMP/cGMP phosphodiesterase (DHH superfamily)
MIRIFNHTDPDGYCSAALVRNHHRNLGVNVENIRCYNMNYHKTFPLDDCLKDELIYIVDFSIDPSEVDRLIDKGCDVIWIDHHKTAIDAFNDYLDFIEKDLRVKGIRENGTAACALTWKYLYPDKEMPFFVELIADYDVWTWKYTERTQYLNNILYSKYCQPNAKIWEDMYNETFLADLLYQGKIMEEYRKADLKRYMRTMSFQTTVSGHKALAVNRSGLSSNVYDLVDKDDAEILMTFGYDGTNTRVSLYSINKSAVDVSEIAKTYGGGGHADAAGFTLSGMQLPKP